MLDFWGVIALDSASHIIIFPDSWCHQKSQSHSGNNSMHPPPNFKIKKKQRQPPRILCQFLYLVVEPTHLKNMLVKFGSFPQVIRGENKKHIWVATT